MFLYFQVFKLEFAFCAYYCLLSPKIHYIFNILLFTNIKKYDTIL